MLKEKKKGQVDKNRTYTGKFRMMILKWLNLLD